MDNKTLFLDRDGTVIFDYNYITSIDQVEFIPGAIDALSMFQKHGYLIVFVTNQSGIGRGYVSMQQVRKIHTHIDGILNQAGITVLDYLFCPHLPNEGCTCRKPRPGMIHYAVRKYGLSLECSLMVGDNLSDTEAGRAAGIASVLISGECKSTSVAENGICTAPSLIALASTYFSQISVDRRS